MQVTNVVRTRMRSQSIELVLGSNLVDKEGSDDLLQPSVLPPMSRRVAGQTVRTPRVCGHGVDHRCLAKALGVAHCGQWKRD
eukprot:4100067-Pleurochrysis_carterae.AAC.3